jgi:uncharacterized repeat protein (TIGR01451 family)
MPVGAVDTATITAEVEASSGSITNTANESQTNPDPSGVQSSSVTINPTSAANVSIVKTVSNATPADGTDVTYTLRLSNAGPDVATGVVVSDTVPDDLVCLSTSAPTGTTISGCVATITWTVGAMPVGAVDTATITAEVEASSGSITNTANESQTNPDPSGVPSSSVTINPTTAANVSILKTVDNSAPADGTDVTYTLQLTNAGPDAATGVIVRDPLPAGITCLSDSAPAGTSMNGCGTGTLTWTVGTLADGGVVTATIRVRVDADSGAITNTATETQTNANPSGMKISSVMITPTAAANVSIVKTVNNSTPADGTVVMYTLKLSNAGPDAATGVVVSDPLPAGIACLSDSAPTGTSMSGCGTGALTWTVGTFADGGTLTATITVRVDADSGTITNTATETQTNPNPSGHRSSSVSINPAPVANVSILKTVNNSTPAGFTDFTYTLELTNAGPDAATGVVVSDPLPTAVVCLGDSAPAGTSMSGCATGTLTWTVGAMADGAVLTATLTVEVVASSGSITNTATEAQTTADPRGVQISSVTINPTRNSSSTPVPPVNTGEPWSGWLYELLFGLLVMAGALFAGIGWRRRKLLLGGETPP